MSTRPIVSIIAAVAENGVIGAAGAMPWRLSTDMKRFKRLTMGRPVVMGRKTFDSIGKRLAGRRTIVVTRQHQIGVDGVETAESLPAALTLAGRNAAEGEVFVAGGGEIYADAIGAADRLYITFVAARPRGDVHFPPIDRKSWKEISSESFPAGERDSAPTRFVVFERTGDSRLD
ncbi:MAG: dihydrofolate reductase [Hyphomicrobiales bacterium]|nr:dihydrofolate reductase [Hyphomicrobiales bacterium]